MAKSKDVKVIADKICVSTSALYEILDVDESTLVRWAEKGCPKVKRGWWSIKDVLDWRNASLKKVSEKNIDEVSLAEKKLFYESKIKEAQSEALYMKNQVAQGVYLEKKAVVDELVRVFTILKKSMLNFSKKITTELTSYLDETEAKTLGSNIYEITLDALNQISINGVYKS